tara:strand:- start:258 stop:512 length:255 start_codon:yes stop_codon:yes gene_type:complete
MDEVIADLFAEAHRLEDHARCVEGDARAECLEEAHFLRDWALEAQCDGVLLGAASSTWGRLRALWSEWWALPAPTRERAKRKAS